MSRSQVKPPSNKQIACVLLSVVGVAIAVPVGYLTWAYVSWQYGDDIAESLGLVPPDEHCMLTTWVPQNELDVDPRQFCNTTLKRNHGSVVDLERKRSAEAEAEAGSH